MDMIMAVVVMLAILCVYGAYESRLKHLERMSGVRGKGHPEFLVFHQLGTGREVSLRSDAIKGFTQMENGAGTVLFLCERTIEVKENYEEVGKKF